MGPLEIALAPVGPGTFSGAATLAYAGEWTVVVRARPSDFVSTAGKTVITVTD